jgi:aminomethyltransferase
MQAETRRRAQPEDTILAAGEAVGNVTSAAFSPSLGASIALGYVQTAQAAVGKPLTIRTARAELPVETVDRPFYRNGTCRARAE